MTTVPRDAGAASHNDGTPAEPAFETDVWVYRGVVAALGLTVLLGVIGMIVLAIAGKEAPAGLIALGSTALGALAGLLVPAPTGRH